MTLYFATPEIIRSTLQREKLNFLKVGSPLIVVDRLSKEVIYETLEHYDEDELKLYHYFEEILLEVLEPLEIRQREHLELLNKYFEDQKDS